MSLNKKETNIRTAEVSRNISLMLKDLRELVAATDDYPPDAVVTSEYGPGLTNLIVTSRKAIR